MSKRKEALQSATEDKVKVDIEEILAADKHSLEGLEHTEKGKLMQVEKSIKSLLSNKSTTLGNEFVSLFEEKNSINNRIALIKEVLKYVEA